MEGNSYKASLGFLDVLTIVFIVLKLIGVITWSWFWVLSPLILSLTIDVVLLILIVIAAACSNR